MMAASSCGLPREFSRHSCRSALLTQLILAECAGSVKRSLGVAAAIATNFFSKLVGLVLLLGFRCAVGSPVELPQARVAGERMPFASCQRDATVLWPVVVTHVRRKWREKLLSFVRSAYFFTALVFLDYSCCVVCVAASPSFASMAHCVNKLGLKNVHAAGGRSPSCWAGRWRGRVQ